MALEGHEVLLCHRQGSSLLSDLSVQLHLSNLAVLERYFLTCDSKVTKETQVFRDSLACQEEQELPEEMATQDSLDPKALRVQ